MMPNTSQVYATVICVLLFNNWYLYTNAVDSDDDDMHQYDIPPGLLIPNFNLQNDYAEPEKIFRDKLCNAVLTQNIDSVKAILSEYNVDEMEPHMKDVGLSDAIVMAVHNGDYNMTQLLIENNAMHSYYRNPSGHALSLLWTAIATRQTDMAKLLMANGADPNKRIHMDPKRSPAMLAIDLNYLEIIKFMCTESTIPININPVNVFDPSQVNQNLLMYACQYGKLDIINYFIEIGQAKIDDVDTNDKTCLWHAQASNNVNTTVIEAIMEMVVHANSQQAVFF